ncbi:MAG: hypothetical protein WBO55_01160 [Rhizobiaceae bacterium]
MPLFPHWLEKYEQIVTRLYTCSPGMAIAQGFPSSHDITTQGTEISIVFAPDAGRKAFLLLEVLTV